MFRPLWISSIRQRPIAATSILAIVVLTTLASVLGPIMLRAVEQSALQESLAAAERGRDDIVFTVVSSDAFTVGQGIASTQGTALTVQSSLFAAAVTLAESDPLNWRPSAASVVRQRVRVAADPDGCVRFVITTGRCARAVAEVVVPAPDVAAGRARVGSLIAVGGEQRRYRVVGAYDPGRSAALVSAVIDPASATINSITGPDLIMTMAGLINLAVPTRVSARLPLRSERLSMDEIGPARAAVGRARQGALEQGQLMAVDTGLVGRLDAVDDDRRAAQALVLVVVIQALALAWFSAIVVMTLVARVRAREWALGRLRGVRRRSWLIALFAEPLILLAAGTVAGLGLGTLLARAAAGRWLRAGTGIEPLRPPVLLAAGLAVVGLVGALVAGSVRGARAPLASLLEDAEPARVSRFALIGQVLVVALAGASVYQLYSSDNLVATSARLALMAPALLAAAVGVLTIAVAARFVRTRTRRPARSVAGILILRPLARVPSALQRNIAVAIVVALAVFATQLAALSTVNQQLRADAIVGADSVLNVGVRAGVNLRDAVRIADPSGRYAMAAVERAAASDGGTSRIVAVDTARLPAVMNWHPAWGGGLSAQQLAARLRPSRPGPVTISGHQIRVAVTDAVLTARFIEQGGPTSPRPELRVVVSDGLRWDDISLGQLRSGASRMSAPISCPRECRIVRLYLDNSGDNFHTTYTASFTVTAVSSDRQPDAELAPVLRDATRWQAWVTGQQPGEQAAAQPAATPLGLHINVQDLLGDSKPGVSSADAPDPLPALVATTVKPDATGAIPGARVGTGLDGQRQLITLVGPPSFLPRGLDDGVLVDLDYVTALSDPSTAEVQPEVWLRDGAPASIRIALTKAGITVVRTETIGVARHTLALAGAARAATTNLVLIAVAALMGAAVIVATQFIDATRRRTVWAVAHSSRIDRRRMTRLVVLEIAAPAGLGAVIGAGAGTLAIWLAGTRLPLFASGLVRLPLDVSVRWALVVLVCGVAAVVVVAVATAAAVVEAARDRNRR